MPVHTVCAYAIRSPGQLIVATGALQLASPPPCSPEHVQVHGPEPETDEAEPDEQRPELGAEAIDVPSAEPQAPVTIGSHVGGVVVVHAEGLVLPLKSVTLWSRSLTPSTVAT